MQKQWSILLAERAVLISLDQDRERFGKAFSHPFLAVANENGQVVQEIHGTWNRRVVGKIATGLIEKFAGATHHEERSRALSRALPVLFPKAFLVAVQRAKDIDKAEIIHPVFEGDRGAVEGHIQSLKATFAALNHAAQPFFRYATPGSGFANCQVMLSSAIMAAQGFPSVPDLKLAQTGWQIPAATVRPAPALEFA